MSDKNRDWLKELATTANEISEAGVPGIGLLAKFAAQFHTKQLEKRFEKFIEASEIDDSLLEKVIENEDYSNFLYSTLETVRQTHSKLGLAALALIYKDHWNHEEFLIDALRAFSQVSDKTLLSFIELYESIPEDKDYLELKVRKDGAGHFHDQYKEAVELIGRGFFVQSDGSGIHANGPIQGMKWDQTREYYEYCKEAKRTLGV
tara:strand:- start:599 stop:1213 length:615 start_codon:yes stop_codon:yes gene_type:complete